MKKIALQTPGNGPDGNRYEFNPPSGTGLPDGGLTDLQSVISWGTTIFLMVATTLALIFLVWGGIEWITSGGDREKIQLAQKRMVYAAIGLVVTLSAFMIINVFGYLFDVSFFNY